MDQRIKELERKSPHDLTEKPGRSSHSGHETNQSMSAATEVCVYLYSCSVYLLIALKYVRHLFCGVLGFIDIL